MALLEGKTVLVTGILTDQSLAFSIAQRAQLEGATVIATGFGRGLSLTRRVLRKLPEEPELVELDVTDEAQLAAAAQRVGELTDRLDGLVHAIGFAPPDCLGDGMLTASASDVAMAFQISSYSLAALCRSFLPLLRAAEGASVVGLDFDATVAWPLYDWMGPTKAALESIVRYLARDLGARRVRVNSLAAGPLETIAARAVSSFEGLKDAWGHVAPLKWDSSDATPVADAAVFLLSDLARGVTGEMLHVDGGFHSQGGAPAQLRPPEAPVQ